MAAFARQYVDELCDVLRSVPVHAVVQVLEILEKALMEDHQVFIAGNGGSAATASHIANDLCKTVINSNPSQKGFRAIALTDNVPLLTAWANDVGYEEIFAGQLRSLAKPGDVLIVVSGSGNSVNVIRAAKVARDMGLVIIGLLGRDGGQLQPLVDAAVVVPAEEYGLIEDAHLAVNHLITAYFRNWLRAKLTAEVSLDE
jgi:D-sedoheptulose 7-phosphate isomerase